MADDTEFGRDDRAISNRPKLAPDQFLIVIRPIHVGGIEKIDSQFERAMERRNRFGVVARSVEFRHAHASESKFGNYQTLGAELTLLHFRFTHESSPKQKTITGDYSVSSLA